MRVGLGAEDGGCTEVGVVAGEGGGRIYSSKREDQFERELGGLEWQGWWVVYRAGILGFIVLIFPRFFYILILFFNFKQNYFSLVHRS